MFLRKKKELLYLCGAKITAYMVMEFIWIYLYYLSYQIAGKLALTISDDRWCLPLTMFTYTGMLLGWVFHSGNADKFCLHWKCLNKQCLWHVVPAMLVFPAYNLLTNPYLQTDIASILLIVSMCTAEEVFFRGFLFQNLRKYNVKVAVLISSIVFALYHFGNLLILDVAAVWFQVMSAFAAGMCYAFFLVLTDSLPICIFAHCLTNLTAAPSNTVDFNPELLVVCICISVFYFAHFFNKLSDYSER